MAPSNTQCACPGDVLTFVCTIVGGGNTIWSGSAFNCSSTENEIILRHTQFASEGTFGDCSSGAIVSRSIGVEDNNCFVSQLNVTASTNFNRKTVVCGYSSNTGPIFIGNETLNVISGNIMQLPKIQCLRANIIIKYSYIFLSITD